MNARLGQWAETIRAWGFFKLVRTIELLAILIAFVAFFNELSYRHEERTARAWQVLTTGAPGNSGKIEALKYLHGRGISLRGIDLTPPVLAELWKQIPVRQRELRPECPQFVYLREVKLPRAELIDAVLVCADLQKADLREADLRQADLQGAFLLGADLRGAKLKKTKLRFAFLDKADLRGAKEINCDQLKEATINNKGEGWNRAYRDKELACGKEIPTPPPVATPLPILYE